MTATSQNRRRRHIVNPEFQWRFLRNILLLEVLVFGVAVLATLAADHLLFSPIVSAGSYWREVAITVGVLFLAVAGALLYLGLRLTNHISGPIYRVERILESVSRGELPELCRFRDGDEHQHLAASVTQALAALRSRQAARAEAIAEIRRLAGQAPTELGERIQALADSLK